MLRRLLPVSRLGLALWAWQHRDRIADWGQFAVRAGTGMWHGNGLDDARTELRLRTALATDRRTRDAGITVEVVDGVARLRGTGAGPARDAALELADATKGVRRVVDLVEVPRRHRFARA
jgi:hypothetical protein